MAQRQGRDASEDLEVILKEAGVPAASRPMEKRSDVLQGSFETIIYVVIDNGWHIFLAYWAALYLL